MRIVHRPEEMSGLLRLLDELAETREEIVLHEEGRMPVVMVPLDDFQALRGVAKLLASSDAADRLQRAIDRRDARANLRLVAAE